MPIKIVTRAEWMAREPLYIEPLKTPVKDVLLIPTYTKNKMTEDEVVRWLPELQRLLMSQDELPDIPYNWLVDFHGNIYEGRGWKTTVYKKTLKYQFLNKLSLDIGLIGTFKDKNPPRTMERTVTKLIELGQEQGFIVKSRELTLHNWITVKEV